MTSETAKARHGGSFDLQYRNLWRDSSGANHLRSAVGAALRHWDQITDRCEPGVDIFLPWSKHRDFLPHDQPGFDVAPSRLADDAEIERAYSKILESGLSRHLVELTFTIAAFSFR